MNIGFLITARLKSTRLKFKILKPLNGYSVIERVIQRAKQIKLCNDIVLCTSCLSQDLPLVTIAEKNNINYFKGSSDDVLQRLLDAAELFKMDYFLGITADNPLFSIYHANMISNLIMSVPNLIWQPLKLRAGRRCRVVRMPARPLNWCILIMLAGLALLCLIAVISVTAATACALLHWVSCTYVYSANKGLIYVSHYRRAMCRRLKSLWRRVWPTKKCLITCRKASPGSLKIFPC